MGIIQRPNVYVSGDIIYASKHNENEEKIFNEFNGNITDDNIHPNANISEHKILFDLINGHNHDGVNSRHLAVQDFVIYKNMVIQGSYDDVNGQPAYISVSGNQITIHGDLGVDFKVNIDNEIFTLSGVAVTKSAYSGMNWLFAFKNASGDLDFDITNVEPVYGYIRPSSSTGQYFYNYHTQKMEYYDGSSWVERPAVLIFYGDCQNDDWTDTNSWYRVVEINNWFPEYQPQPKVMRDMKIFAGEYFLDLTSASDSGSFQSGSFNIDLPSGYRTTKNLIFNIYMTGFYASHLNGNVAGYHSVAITGIVDNNTYWTINYHFLKYDMGNTTPSLGARFRWFIIDKYVYYKSL